jgi:PhzF family phenazine biosynthesis protein
LFEPFSIVDAFTDRPFSGNPAGVIVRQEPADDAWMHRIAAEIGASETAFLHPEGKSWRLRWFTPEIEIELCGHATLASAHTLWESGRVPESRPIDFVTQSGILTARRQNGKIALDFPARIVKRADPPPGLVDALGVAPKWVGRWKRDWLIEVATANEVRVLSPDHQALAATRVRAVTVTAPGDRGFDVVSRFFGPGVGVVEDPVTGAAHCAIGPFWAARLGRNELKAWQASARGGSLDLAVDGDRVELRGTAVTVARGEILGPNASSTPPLPSRSPT